MKKTTQNYGSLVFAGVTVLASMYFTTQVFAYTQINSQLDLGESNQDVTSLQTFFADNKVIYPEGLITGYFGGLTGSAVLRFQSQYGLDQVGRVGPVTLAKINSLIVTGGWSTVDISGPAFSNVYRSQNNNSGTFGFTTNENTIARVVFNTSPLMFNEGDINSNGFGAIGGYAANSYNNMSTSHIVTITNLQPNTVYYYTIIATDASGNVSVVGPNNSFRTNAQ
ncbi:MAG: peptidoglycan-binding protein [Candidatus Pacebacteria bacterium]|nr:peptidoglycan-binding protein [Candidatus Paceibacterota bacterium]MBP9866583.1 peptidoglycan-binding protein [Candidatus Paceibacterota bacterium]